jgi:ArsR family transcriptional regulator
MLTALKALADPIRLRLLAVLSHGEQTVQDLTATLRLGQSRISHHLKVLCDARILSVKPQGTWKYYRIEPADEFLQTIWPQVAARLEQVPAAADDLQVLNRLLAERRQQSLTFFEAHARQWDERARKLLPTPAYTGELLQMIPPQAALVELGTGTGALLPELSVRSRRLVGIDHSSAMLAEARRRMVQAGLDCDLRLGELRHLPLADAEMDCAVLNMVLHHAEQPLEVLREVSRVLAPGGRVVIADLLRHRDDAVRQTMADVWLGFEPDEIIDGLHAAGFSGITCVQKAAAVAEYGIFLLTATKTIGS